MATIRKTRERIENTEGYEDVLITLSTWNTLLPAEQPSVMSIRDADGRFFTPGFFTGVHGHRSITQVIGAAKLHSARTRRPGFSVSEADVTITLPAGSTLTPPAAGSQHQAPAGGRSGRASVPRRQRSRQEGFSFRNHPF